MLFVRGVLREMLAEGGNKRFDARRETIVRLQKGLPETLVGGAGFVGEFLDAETGFHGEFGYLPAQDLEAGSELGLPPFVFPPKCLILFAIFAALFGEGGSDMFYTFEALFGRHGVPV
jgi:hypothetical protein